MQGSNFGPENFVNEFSIKFWICFADAILVQSPSSNLDQNCAFVQFESGPKLLRMRTSGPEVRLWKNCICEANPTRDTELL